jgi:hypothetical protein
VPGNISEIVVLTPVPVVVTPPGVRTNVHVPVWGKPLSTTLPIATKQVGWVTVPIEGGAGIGFIVASTAVLVPVVQPFAVAST